MPAFSWLIDCEYHKGTHLCWQGNEQILAMDMTVLKEKDENLYSKQSRTQ